MFVEKNEGWSAKRMIHSAAISSKNMILIFGGTDVYSVTLRDDKATLKLTREFTEQHLASLIQKEKGKMAHKKNVAIEAIRDSEVKVEKDWIVEER